jgi:hypothetical protein
VPLTGRRVLGLLSAWIVLLPLPGVAQMTQSHAPPNTEHTKRIEGTLARIDGNELLLKSAGGTTETYQLSPALQILRSHPGQISDLSTGKLVSCTNLYGQSEKMAAGECRVFAPNIRDPAGDRGNPDPTNFSVINGRIADVTDDARAAQGNGQRILMQISRTAGIITMAATSATVVTLLEPADASALKPGAKVIGVSQQAVDGTGVIQTLTVLSPGQDRSH